MSEKEENKKWLSTLLADFFKIVPHKETNLSPVEKTVLQALSTYHYSGVNKIYPSHAALANQTGYFKRTIQRTIEKLKEKKIITVIERFDSTGDRTTNEYRLEVKNLIKKLSTGVVSQCHHLVSQIHHLVSERHQGGVTVTPGVVSQRHPKYINKLNNKMKKRERESGSLFFDKNLKSQSDPELFTKKQLQAIEKNKKESKSLNEDKNDTKNTSSNGNYWQKTDQSEGKNDDFEQDLVQNSSESNKTAHIVPQSRAPANPIDFHPNDANQVLCLELRLNMQEELRSFEHRHKGAKNQYEFERWLKNSHRYQQNNQQSSQPKTTYMDWGPGHPGWESLHRGRKNDSSRDSSG